MCISRVRIGRSYGIFEFGVGSRELREVGWVLWVELGALFFFFCGGRSV